MARKLKVEPNINIDTLEIGKRIATTRKQHGLTQKELSEIIGIKQTLVSDYETGRVRMFAEMVGRFAIALKVPADYLLGLDESSGNNTEMSLRLAKRLNELESLPESRKKAIIRTLDDLIFASGNKSS
jgi:transcriptional regulator with XRE-family HTH domain